jgi:hypothetical protein
MATVYPDEQPRTADGSAAGLVAGLVLVLAVIALIFLATRTAPNPVNNAIDDLSPANNNTAPDNNLNADQADPESSISNPNINVQ